MMTAKDNTDRIWSSGLLDMAGHSAFGEVANFSAPGFYQVDRGISWFKLQKNAALSGKEKINLSKLTKNILPKKFKPQRKSLVRKEEGKRLMLTVRWLPPSCHVHRLGYIQPSWYFSLSTHFLPNPAHLLLPKSRRLGSLITFATTAFLPSLTYVLLG